jgi:hydrogenase-1 operon protein HyaE
MSSPLIENLYRDHGYPRIDRDNHDAFVNGGGVRVLFCPGDPNRYRETNDVAVVLPELDKAFQGLLHPGVVQPEAEQALQRTYGFTAWPALVFLRDGGYLGAITGIRDWHTYLEEIPALLDRPPGRAPGFDVPVVAEPMQSTPSGG